VGYSAYPANPPCMSVRVVGDSVYPANPPCMSVRVVGDSVYPGNPPCISVRVIMHFYSTENVNFLKCVWACECK
jgi:hypothetical protein